jgi:hypothetical protein
MPVEFAPAEPDVVGRMNDALAKRFPQLEDEELNIEVLAATHPDGGPAVKHHGSPALAVIKVVKPEERSTGGPDLRIVVDLARYAKLNRRSQEALFAHELFHVQVAKTKQGKTKRDPYGRPVTRLRPDDWSITGFKEVADWYGEDSIEHRSYRVLGEALRQSLFEFFSRDPDADPESDVVAPPTIPARIAAAVPDATDRRPIRGAANGEVLAGVREAEARGGKQGQGGGETEPEARASRSWRDVSIETLGLKDPTLGTLNAHDVRLVGQLVGLCGSNDGQPPKFLSNGQAIEVSDALDRFRARRSNEDIAEIDATRHPAEGDTEAQPRPTAPKRSRKAQTTRATA